MLRPEECKPGVEVICINSSNQGEFDRLTLGTIYTIRELLYPNFVCAEHGITLHEIPEDVYTAEKYDRYGFRIKRFKLVDPKALDIFKQAISNPTKILEDA